MDTGGWTGATDAEAWTGAVVDGTRTAARVDPREPEAYEYQTEHTLRLADLERPIRATTSFMPRAAERALAVHIVRAAGRAGQAVRVEPTPLADALYLDVRDLAALQAHAIVPGLEEALRAMRAR